jgi:adenosylmethionine-8-amino-7-oxononanoate aminotransferase
VLANGQQVARHFEQGLQALLRHPRVGDARSRGLLGALELVSDKNTKATFDPALQLPDRIARAGYENGLIFRAFADNILGFAPALCFTPSEFEQMFERLNRTLDAVLEQPEVRRALA